MLEERPGPHILGLFLQPDHFLGVRVGGEHLIDLLLWERVELLDAHDGGRGVALGPLGHGIPNHLAAAEHDTTDLLLRDNEVRVVEDLPEVTGGEVVHVGHALLHAQRRLRGEDHERTEHLELGLAAQQVEVLGGRGGVGHLQVVLRTELQEALDPGARVLGALSLEAVRQEHDEAVVLAPLVLCCNEVLVDDDLGTIDEVAELGLPEHQRVVVGL